MYRTLELISEASGSKQSSANLRDIPLQFLEVLMAQVVIGITFCGYAWIGRRRELEEWSRLMYGEPWPQRRVPDDDLEDSVRRTFEAPNLKPSVNDEYSPGHLPNVRAYYAQVEEPVLLRPASACSGLALGSSSLPPDEPGDDANSDHEHTSEADASDSETLSDADESESESDDDEKKRRKKPKKEKQKKKAKGMKKPYHKKEPPMRKEPSHGPRTFKHGKSQYRRPERSGSRRQHGLRGGGGEEEIFQPPISCYDEVLAYSKKPGDPKIPGQLDRPESNNGVLRVEIHPPPPFGPRPRPRSALEKSQSW
ncbi:uncharacterized protein MYCFIDRAFT_77638 [Pseudocercospora fijiensis CIRAD86]|uniref:Uncharacterized protein n=1 Tax=Pseudocercospora fijiensis (strain CIRAD86) TaxID=383855 RepID=M3ABV9_PSEFD|nr:uncharacterized protein MYCFIDRAFT_77638 [Pseudocercospora fijiensis CIRAD86]EME82056.1 hypothetical protein MYCFIDRAFT_77638 [Pseudocercospora fijiensis CIRAD86]